MGPFGCMLLLSVSSSMSLSGKLENMFFLLQELDWIGTEKLG